MRKRKVTWEIKMARWLGSKKWGHLFVGARPYRYGRYLGATEIPKEIFDYCQLKQRGIRWVVDGFSKEVYHIVRKIEISEKIPFLLKVNQKFLEKRLRELNEGRNLDCWSLCSFSWKNADLDPTGCTGIKKIVGFEGKSVIVLVGGRKTACDPTYESEFNLTREDENAYSDIAHEIAAGCAVPGEWTGDDWFFTFYEEVKVPLCVKKNGRIDYVRSAERIVRAAKKACVPFEREWEAMSDALEFLYQEIREKYEAKASKKQNAT